MTDKNHPAVSTFGEFEYTGLTAQEYAAIHLKVADSGTPWLDEMIEKSRRDELAQRFIIGMTVHAKGSEMPITSKDCYTFADAMLAASKGEK